MLRENMYHQKKPLAPKYEGNSDGILASPAAEQILVQRLFKYGTKTLPNNK